MKAPNGKTNLNVPAMPAKAVKPQTVKNTLGRGGGYFEPGTLPAGGFQGVWCFDGKKRDFKNSPTTDGANIFHASSGRPGRKVY